MPSGLAVLVALAGCGGTPPPAEPAPVANVAAEGPFAAPTPTDQPSACEGAQEIDEVWCVLENYPSPCCDRYNKRGGTAATAPTTTPFAGLPDALTPDLIRAGLEPVRDAVIACGNGATGHRVKVRVRVLPDGHPDDVSIAETDDQTLGDCVAAAVRGATFAATAAGGTFSQPYVF